MAAFSKIAVPLISLVLASKIAEAAVADLPITNVDVVFTESQTASLSAATTSAHGTPSITTSSHLRTHSQHEGEISETSTTFSSTATNLTTNSSSTTSPPYTTLSPEPTSSHKLKDDVVVLASGDGAFIEIPLPANKVSELGAERTYFAVPLHFKIIPTDEAHDKVSSEADHGVEHLTTAPAHTASLDTVAEMPASTDGSHHITESFPAETAIAAPFPPESLMTGSTDPYSLPVITSTLPPVELASTVTPTPTTFLTTTSAATTDSDLAPVPQTTGVSSEDAGWVAEPTSISSVTGALADDIFAAATDLPVIPPTAAEGVEKRGIPTLGRYPPGLEDVLRKNFRGKGAAGAITGEDRHAEKAEHSIPALVSGGDGDGA